MNRSQAAILLGVCAAYDRRTVGEVDATAWSAALHDIDLEDARAAVVKHYTETTDWVMPAHVRRLVKSMREARLARQVTPAPPPELADQPRRYQAAFQDNLRRIAAGFAMPKAITAGERAEPTGEYLEARGEDPQRRELRTAAMVVQCPHCGVLAAERCVNAIDKPLSTEPAHEARLVAAGLAEWVNDNGVQRAVLRGAGVE